MSPHLVAPHVNSLCLVVALLLVVDAMIVMLVVDAEPVLVLLNLPPVVLASQKRKGGEDPVALPESEDDLQRDEVVVLMGLRGVTTSLAELTHPMEVVAHGGSVRRTVATAHRILAPDLLLAVLGEVTFGEVNVFPAAIAATVIVGNFHGGVVVLSDFL